MTRPIVLGPEGGSREALRTEEDAETARKALMRLPNNLFASVATHGIVVCSNLVLVPLFLACWSPERYGEWLAISAVAAYLSTADFGMSSAAINVLSRKYTEKDYDGFLKTLHTALSCYVAFALACSLLAVSFSRHLSFAWLGVSGAARGEPGLVVSILIAQIAWSFPLTLVLSFYRAIGNFKHSQWLLNVYRCGLLGFTALGLLSGLQLVGLAALQLGVSLAMLSGVAVWIRCRFPGMSPGFGRTSVAEARSLLASGSSFAVMTVGNAISQQVPVLLVSSMLGAPSVVVFSTVRTLANSVRQIVGVLAVSAWPELTIMQASRRLSEARVTHRLLVIGSAVLSIAAGATLWFLGPQVLQSWTRRELPFGGILVRCFAVQLVLQAPWLASSVVSLSSNNNRTLSRAYIGSAVLGCVLAAAMIQKIGLASVPMAALTAEALICYHIVIRDSCTLLGENYRAFAFRVWSRLPMLMTIAYVTASMISALPLGFIIVRVLVSAMATFAAAGAGAWLMWLEAEDKDAVHRAIRAFAVSIKYVAQKRRHEDPLGDRSLL